nr:contact-dependent growth inhibition system immunity protein [Streptomyces sp. A0642]
MRHPAASADDTRLVTTAHALRRRTIGELTVEDMRLLIGPSSSFTARQPEVGQSWFASRGQPRRSRDVAPPPPRGSAAPESVREGAGRPQRGPDLLEPRWESRDSP